ncbi:hypothetical protein [Bdellovibrio sp. HCB288]|uniref:hypothetical protein n=1 Tax=Bdellovibrio sp. HCB288 TaxID=3394355 RepID=UPI0039B5201A
MKMTLVPIFILIFGSLASAQNGVGFDLGNGGMAASFDGGVHWSSLDLVEGIYRGVSPWRKLLVPVERGDVLKLVIDRAISKCPAQFSGYYDLVNDFYSGWTFAGGPGWEQRSSTGDANISLPEGQYLIALAAIQKQKKDGTTRFYVVRSVWNQLSALDQAALIIHEIMYRLHIRAADARKPNSDWIRPSVAYLFSDTFAESNNPGNCSVFSQ